MPEIKSYAPPEKGTSKTRKATMTVQILDALADIARLASKLPKRAALTTGEADMKNTFFGATIADMDLTKIGLSLQDVLGTLKSVDPTYYGIAAGGTLGGLGMAAATDREDPNRAAKIMLGLSLGSAAGGLAGHKYGPELGLGKQPADSGVVRRASEPVSTAGPTTRSPVAPSAALPPNVKARAISGPASDARLQQTEQSMRQQAAQQADQAVTQAAAAKERAAMLHDQGTVQARMQAFTAPRPSPGGGRPRNITIPPGQMPAKLVASPKFGPGYGGMKTGGVVEDIVAGAKEHPWIPGAVAGGALGTGIGWASGDAKTRKRKMLMGLLTGLPVGALSAETVASLINAADSTRAASEGVRGAADKASDAMSRAGVAADDVGSAARHVGRAASTMAESSGQVGADVTAGGQESLGRFVESLPLDSGTATMLGKILGVK